MRNKKNLFLDYPLWHVIETPFMDKNLLIFSGEEGREIFNNKVKEIYPEWEDDIESDGLTWDNLIYVEDIENNIRVLFHELAHYLDHCTTFLNCKEESEFIACLSEFIYIEIYDTLRGKYK